MEADGQLVVAGGDRPQLLEAVDQPLDSLAAVGGPIEAHALSAAERVDPQTITGLCCHGS